MMRTPRILTLVALGFLVPAAGVWLDAQDNPKIIEIHAKRFSFTPSEITLHVGEKVTIELISDDDTHELVIPDLQVHQEVKKGHPAEITITPDKVGDFNGMCGHYCGTGHGSMTFAVHVLGDGL